MAKKRKKYSGATASQVRRFVAGKKKLAREIFGTKKRKKKSKKKGSRR